MADSRTRIWFSLFVLAVFVAGMAVGMFVGHRVGPRPLFGPPPFENGRGGGGPPGPPPGALLDRLDRDLSLTDEQRTSIQKIFEARHEPLERARREMRDRMEREQAELRTEIRKVLTPEQQPKFDRWLAEDRARGGRGRGRGRGGSFGPPPR